MIAFHHQQRINLQATRHSCCAALCRCWIFRFGLQQYTGLGSSCSDNNVWGTVLFNTALLMDCWLCEVGIGMQVHPWINKVGVEFRVQLWLTVKCVGVSCCCSYTTRLDESIPSTIVAQCDLYCRYVVSHPLEWHAVLDPSLYRSALQTFWIEMLKFQWREQAAKVSDAVCASEFHLASLFLVHVVITLQLRVPSEIGVIFVYLPCILAPS